MLNLPCVLDFRRLHHRRTRKVRMYMVLTSKSSTSQRSSFTTAFNCRSCENVDAPQRFKLIDSVNQIVQFEVSQSLNSKYSAAKGRFGSFCSKGVEKFIRGGYRQQEALHPCQNRYRRNSILGRAKLGRK